MKRVGEMAEPCGTPALGVKGMESEFLYFIVMVRSVRKLHNSFWIIVGKLNDSQILNLRPSCQTVSKAFLVSLVIITDL